MTERVGDEGAPRADRFLAQLSGDTTLWVPALWWYELANALTMAHRRRRLAEADRVQALALYAKLPLRTELLDHVPGQVGGQGRQAVGAAAGAPPRPCRH